ncbi:hypothetical protein HRI_004126200 [Hibiscus trionum]|uniref:Reverse transcriptase domain-containing protein n=1 Tax=Hibiscus trionum TaxID=183268 RepID=A0A9W7MM50_HIBTR|nr:hypothetical protein HRI_004126200 [Hibiscus trionum]
MGFGHKWRRWIFLCISTAKISVLINGKPTKMFPIGRGLRQGCPLSPFLFNIFGEALSVLLRKATNENIIKGVEVGRNGMKISHLQFADDLIIFAKADLENVKCIKRVLRLFEIASGLCLNMKKTTLYGVNVDLQCVEC